MPTFLLFLRTLGFLLRTVAAVGAIRHRETPVINVTLYLGFIFVTLTERTRGEEIGKEKSNALH